MLDFSIWCASYLAVCHNYDAIVDLIVEMADSTITFEIAVAAFVSIMLSL